MMDPQTYMDPQLTVQDRMVIETLLHDTPSNGHGESRTSPVKERIGADETTIMKLRAMNDASHPDFDPTVFQLWDTPVLRSTLSTSLQRYVLQPYLDWAQGVVRVPTDVVMVTHLIMYFTTIVPSAFFLYYRFSWLHGVLHWAMQLWYCGAFTLMKHQHIHMNGVLASRYWVFDTLFPYLLDPLLGHTWNSYYYHHIKHHHVEGNGEDDLSSTMFYDRDSVRDFACYVGRFIFLVWLELPLYFWRKRQTKYACQAAFWELGNYAMIYLLYNYVNARATLFALILPLTVMRCGLMVGNWGQHAFVDPTDPHSDYLSSVTLIDVPVGFTMPIYSPIYLIFATNRIQSNRFSFNDGYHTSHHLNPRRHWRDHPAAFVKGRERYAEERALVFRNVDFIFITVNLLRKDYLHLARCLIPMGEQVDMTLEQRADMLRTRARRFPRSKQRKTC